MRTESVTSARVRHAIVSTHRTPKPLLCVTWVRDLGGSIATPESAVLTADVLTHIGEVWSDLGQRCASLLPGIEARAGRREETQHWMFRLLWQDAGSHVSPTTAP